MFPPILNCKKFIFFWGDGVLSFKNINHVSLGGSFLMRFNKLPYMNKREKKERKKMVGEALTQVATDYFAWRVGPDSWELFSIPRWMIMILFDCTAKIKQTLKYREGGNRASHGHAISAFKKTGNDCEMTQVVHAWRAISDEFTRWSPQPPRICRDSNSLMEYHEFNPCPFKLKSSHF